MTSRLVLLCLILSGCFLYLAAQQNPLLPSTGKTAAQDTLKKKSPVIPFNTYNRKIPFLYSIIQYQKRLTQSLTDLLKTIKYSFSAKHILILFGIAFFYGMIHALGPGHAKLIIGSYMLSNKHDIRHSFIAGGIFAATHVGMALLIFLLFNAVLHMRQVPSSTLSPVLFKMSGIMITIIGIALLLPLVMKKTPKIVSSFVKTRSLHAISMISGFMPCPGALLILIFSRIIGITFYGILATIFLSLGMALTVSIAGSFGVMANKAIHLSVQGNILKYTAKSVRILGIVVIIIIGLVMSIQ